MDNNICKFVPTRSSGDQINTVNFVYETIIPQRNQFITKSTYMIYLVTEGRGTLCHTQKSVEIRKGDLFFTFPSTPFAIEVSDSNLKYIYISFLGIRAGRILEEMKIGSGNCVFRHYDFLEEFWTGALDIATQYNLDMLSESVLLYTLSVLSGNTLKEEKLSRNADNILQIKNISTTTTPFPTYPWKPSAPSINTTANTCRAPLKRCCTWVFPNTCAPCASSTPVCSSTRGSPTSRTSRPCPAIAIPCIFRRCSKTR